MSWRRRRSSVIRRRWAPSRDSFTVCCGLAGRRELGPAELQTIRLQASLQRRGDRHAVYADVAAVYYGGSEFPVRQETQIIPTLIVGYEYQLTPTTNINIQTYASTSAYSSRLTDLDELTGNKYQYSLGVRHRRGWAVLTFGVTENVQNLNNTPDIGFHLGVAYLPPRNQTYPSLTKDSSRE